MYIASEGLSCVSVTMEKTVSVFDVETFIAEVQLRPVLWDCSTPDYSNKVKKAEAWNEICRIYNKDFDALSPQEKKIIGKYV